MEDLIIKMLNFIIFFNKNPSLEPGIKNKDELLKRIQTASDNCLEPLWNIYEICALSCQDITTTDNDCNGKLPVL